VPDKPTMGERLARYNGAPLLLVCLAIAAGGSIYLVLHPDTMFGQAALAGAVCLTVCAVFGHYRRQGWALIGLMIASALIGVAGLSAAIAIAVELSTERQLLPRDYVILTALTLPALAIVSPYLIACAFLYFKFRARWQPTVSGAVDIEDNYQRDRDSLPATAHSTPRHWSYGQ
jgi:hypothetical protein